MRGREMERGKNEASTRGEVRKCEKFAPHREIGIKTFRRRRPSDWKAVVGLEAIPSVAGAKDIKWLRHHLRANARIAKIGQSDEGRSIQHDICVKQISEFEL